MVQERSYGSVRVFWLNREEVLRRLREAVQKLLAEKKDIKEIRLFGSLAEGRAVPGSDVDLLLVMEKTEKSFWARAEDLWDYFAEIGLPCELFCYTEEEIARIDFARKAYEKGVLLGKRKG